MTRSPLPRLAALALVVALAAACGANDYSSKKAGSSDQQSSASASSDTTGAEVTDKVKVAKLRWAPCDKAFECAQLRVPLDYAKPDGKKITLALARQPAADPKQRIGSLLVDPGGPGASAIEFMEEVAPQVTKEFTARFDLVGVDPRGIGRSTPTINCGSDAAANAAVDPTIEDAAGQQKLLSTAKSYTQQCKAKMGDLLSHVGTRNVVRDYDVARRALGDSKLTYLGLSYGTSIGAVYAAMFPKRVRAMVLDGVVDTAKSGAEAAEAQAKGFDLAYAHFAAGCQAQGAACPAGPDAIATFRLVAAKVEAAPVPSSQADRPAGPGELYQGTLQTLYKKEMWPTLAKALAAANQGDGSPLVKLTDEYLKIEGKGTPSLQTEGLSAVSCLDTAWPRDTNAVFAAAQQAKATAPLYGEFGLSGGLTCAQWPVKADPLGAQEVSGAPPIVVVGTTGDPATPYEAAQAVARRIKGSVLLTYQGDGHVAFATSKCASKAEVKYLLTLELPPPGTQCTE